MSEVAQAKNEVEKAPPPPKALTPKEELQAKAQPKLDPGVRDAVVDKGVEDAVAKMDDKQAKEVLDRVRRANADPLRAFRDGLTGDDDTDTQTAVAAIIFLSQTRAPIFDDVAGLLVGFILHLHPLPPDVAPQPPAGAHAAKK
jgi:hypothetical protein